MPRQNEEIEPRKKYSGFFGGFFEIVRGVFEPSPISSNEINVAIEESKLAVLYNKQLLDSLPTQQQIWHDALESSREARSAAGVLLNKRK